MTRFEIDTIKDAIDHPHVLNAWENGFINDLAEVDNSKNLSSKQKSKLIEIAEKIDNFYRDNADRND